jgi:hypothetical protein
MTIRHRIITRHSSSEQKEPPAAPALSGNLWLGLNPYRLYNDSHLEIALSAEPGVCCNVATASQLFFVENDFKLF